MHRCCAFGVHVPIENAPGSCQNAWLSNKVVHVCIPEVGWEGRYLHLGMVYLHGHLLMLKLVIPCSRVLASVLLLSVFLLGFSDQCQDNGRPMGKTRRKKLAVTWHSASEQEGCPWSLWAPGTKICFAAWMSGRSIMSCECVIVQPFNTRRKIWSFLGQKLHSKQSPLFVVFSIEAKQKAVKSPL